MKFKKIISAAVGAVMLCASLPFSSTTVNFAENTLKANAADSASAKKITLDSVTKFEKAGAVVDGDTAYVTWNKETYELLQSDTGFDSTIETGYGKVDISIKGGEISLEGNVDLSKQFATKIADQIKNKLDGYTISDSDINVKGNVEITLAYGGLKDGYSLGVTKATYTDGDTTIDLSSVDTNNLKEYSNSKLAEIKENIKADLKSQIAADYNHEVAANAKFDELEVVVDDYAAKAESKINKLDKTVSVENAATADDAIAELAKKAGTQSIDSVDSFFSKNIIANTVTSALNVISQKAGEASKGKYEVAISEDDIKSFAKTGTNVSATYSTSAASTSFNFEDGEKSFELDGKTYEIVDGKKLFEAKYTGSEVEVKVSAKVKKVEETTETTEEATTAVTTTTKLTTTTTKRTTTTSVTTTNETTFSTKQTTTTTKSAKFVDGADNWSFPNSSSNFGSSYYMNDDYWNALLEGLSNKEKILINDNVKNEYWGGSCYGMAATSILACNGILNPENYQEDASFLHDISAPPTNEEKSLINYYFALQFTDVIQQKVCENFYSDDEKTKLQTLISCLENDTPTLLCFYGYFYGFSWGGHAVVAYGLEYGKYSIDGKAYNGKVMIYDNNNVDYSDDFCLYFNSSKGSWTIPYYELDSENESRLGLITNDMKYINYHGYLNGTNDVSINNYIATLQSAAISGEYNLVKANYKNGSWINASTSEDDIKMLSSLSDNNFENSDLVFAMKDASSGYIMKTKNPENLDLSLSYENSLLSAKASNGTVAKFSPDGCVEIDGDSTSYSLGLVLNDGYTVTDWYGLTVEGKGTDKAILKLEKDGYVLQSANLDNISVSGYNDSVTADVKFSTNYDKAYIYEIDEKTIGVAVDTDNNGTYETVIAKSNNNTDKPTEAVYGDVNVDDNVTIADAVLLNKYLVNSATLSEQGKINADAYFDKVITSADTLAILKLIVGTYDSLPIYP